MNEDFVVQAGPSLRDRPFPSPELDLGNLVKLKEPYLVIEEGEHGSNYTHGLIIQHVSYNFNGIPKVGLALFNEQGNVHCLEPGFPEIVDMTANEFVILSVTDRRGRTEFGVAKINDGAGFDMYPKCPGYGDKDQHPFLEDADRKCPQCDGLGFVKNQDRIPQSATKS